MRKRRWGNEGGELEEIKSRRQRPRQRANRGGKQRKCVCVCEQKRVKEREQTVPKEHSSRI